MPRILIRAHKSPFRVATAEQTVARDLIGSNVGNLVFSQAVYRLLCTRGAELATSGVARTGPQRINAEFDHLVIPLANAFRPSYLDTLDALSAVLERVRIPVTVVGVGAQANLRGERKARDRVDESTRRFVRAVLDRSPSIGVRGAFTRDYLRALGFGDAHVEVIGCPSMFMYGPHLRVQKRVASLGPDSPIALNISPYVARMGPLSLDHAERYPRLVYRAQDRRSLELLLHGSYPMGEHSPMRRSGVPVSLDHPLVASDRVRFCLDPQTWIEHLRGYAFSFGTRIHGNIVALLAGTPALVLAHDSRTLELAEYHEIPRRTLTDLPPRPDAAELYAAADWSGLNGGHAARWDRFGAFLTRHGLRHAYLDGEDPTRFDTALAAVDFPPPVGTLMGLPPAELYAMKRALEAVEPRRPALVRVRERLERVRPGRLVRQARARLRRRAPGSASRSAR